MRAGRRFARTYDRVPCRLDMEFTVTSSTYPRVAVRAGETLLNAFLRHGIDLPFSCRGGVCQSCLLRAEPGQAPARAQWGVDPALAQRGYFMPCVCEPERDMRIEPPRPEDFASECIVESVHEEHGALHVWLEPLRAVRARLGDHVRVACGSGEPLRARVVSLPEQGFYLELVLDDASTHPQCTQEHLGQTVWVRPESPAEARAAAERPSPRPPLDPGLWRELGDGRVVRAVLDDFYARVYLDPLLEPFFRGVTREHVAGKQYAFLHRSMTGADVYFGDHPRAAHHWMVISDALFEHRQSLMARVQREHGLTDEQMRRWSRFETPYRGEIVKSRPMPVTRFGVELPLDGHEHVTLEVGAICDACGAAVDAGTRVLTHRRLGTIACPACAAPD